MLRRTDPQSSANCLALDERKSGFDEEAYAQITWVHG
jgi:hypothetical protein